jgi:hypothetical protein
LGTLRLSYPILSGPLANKPIAVATSTTSVGSSSEANSPVSIEPVESRGNIIDLLDGIKEKFDFMETSTVDQKKSSTASTTILKRTGFQV